MTAGKIQPLFLFIFYFLETNCWLLLELRGQLKMVQIGAWQNGHMRSEKETSAV